MIGLETIAFLMAAILAVQILGPAYARWWQAKGTRRIGTNINGGTYG